MVLRIRLKSECQCWYIRRFSLGLSISVRRQIYSDWLLSKFEQGGSNRAERGSYGCLFRTEDFRVPRVSGQFGMGSVDIIFIFVVFF